MNPDFTSVDFEISTQPLNVNPSVLIFYECKATRKTLSISYREGQLMGMIDALNQLQKQKLIKYKHFYIARTCDAKISTNLISESRTYCVNLYEEVAIKKGTKISFKDPHRLTDTCAELDLDSAYGLLDFWNDAEWIEIDDIISNLSTSWFDLLRTNDPDPRSGDDDGSEKNGQ